jgi:hypothetical protein
LIKKWGGAIFMANTNDKKPQSPGWTLLENTFDAPEDKEISANVVAFAKIYQAMGAGNISVNGQPPNADVNLGEYLIHGGRVQFDLSKLDEAQKKQFYKYVFGGAEIQQRKFATHRFVSVPKDKRKVGPDMEELPPALEMKTTLYSAWQDQVTPVEASHHKGMNIPIGGEGKKENGHLIEGNGTEGHLYIHDSILNNGMLMIGIEGSEPGKKNFRTGQGHSKVGTMGEKSAFMEDKQCETINPTANKFNVICIKIEPEHLDEMVQHQINKNTFANKDKKKEFLDKLKTKPKGAVVYDEKRKEKMKQYANAVEAKQKDAERMEKAKGVGLVTAGVTMPGLFVTGSGATYATRKIKAVLKKKKIPFFSRSNNNNTFNQQKTKQPSRLFSSRKSTLHTMMRKVRAKNK